MVMHAPILSLIRVEGTVLSGVQSRTKFYGRVTLRDDHLMMGGHLYLSILLSISFIF